MKLMLDRIDWPSIDKAMRDWLGDAAYGAAARREFATLEPYVFTASFVERVMAFESEVDDIDQYPVTPDDAPMLVQVASPAHLQQKTADHTILHIVGNELTSYPVPEGGILFHDIPSGESHVPPAFGIARPQAELDRYGRILVRFMRTATAMMALPERRIITDVPGRRVVRKGRSVRLPDYRTVTHRPGAETLVHAPPPPVAGAVRRESPVEHLVGGHWVSRGLNPDCAHYWEDATTPEVTLRERCAACGGKRTWRKGYTRGTRKDDRPVVNVLR